MSLCSILANFFLLARRFHHQKHSGDMGSFLPSTLSMLLTRSTHTGRRYYLCRPGVYIVESSKIFPHNNNPLPLLHWHTRKSIKIPMFFFLLSFLQVSWVRQSDLAILASGGVSHTSDNRITASADETLTDWELQIAEAQTKDSVSSPW